MSLTSKTKLYFNVLPKIVSRSHTNKPWSYLPEDNSFTVYCTYNTHFNSVRTHIQFSPYVYPYTFVCTRAILTCHVFGLCLSVRVPLSPDRCLPLSPNSILNVRPQISTEHPLLFIVGLICNDYTAMRAYQDLVPHHQNKALRPVRKKQ